MGTKLKEQGKELTFAELINVNVVIGNLKLKDVEMSDIRIVTDLTRKLEDVAKEAEAVQKKIQESYELEQVGGRVNFKGHEKEKEIQKAYDDFGEQKFSLTFTKYLKDDVIAKIVEQNDMPARNIRIVQDYLGKPA